MTSQRVQAGVILTVAVLVSTPVITTASQLDGPPRSSDRPELDDPAEVEAWLDETMADQLEEHRIPGAAVVVVSDGEFVVSKGYGYADLDAREPVAADETIFGVGSTAKLLTWTAVMQGVEAGDLDLDRDVNDYLTDSPVTVPDTYPRPITLEHLGTHTAGYEDAFGGTLVDEPSDLRPLGEVLAENQPTRVRPPGEFVAYSNYGAGLAGHVVAEQYETAFTEYVEKRILDPLEMDNSTYEQPLPARLRPRLASEYTYQNGEYRAQPLQTWGMAPEGGAMRSTATDMGRFMLAYLGEGSHGSERILEPETVREMHRQHFDKAPDAPDVNGMAYGFIEMDRNDERIVGHWGDTASSRSMLALLPERDTGVFVVYNSPGGQTARFDFLQAFVDRYYPDSRAPVVEPPGAAERADRLTGDYRSLTVSETTWHRAFGVLTRTVSVGTTEDGYLTTRQFGGEPRTWIEQRPGIYDAVGGDEQLAFRFDEEGAPTHLFFGNFGPATYERVPWYESLSVYRAILLGGTLAFVSTLALWAGAAVRRRIRETSAPSARERVARALLGVVSLLWLSVAAIFLFATIEIDAEVASPSSLLRVGLALPYLALAGTLGASVFVALAWRDAYWNTPVRIHYTLATVAAVLFTWALYSLRILGL
ncbi:serine hydrolase domain-containing protein [Halosimplex salinum]|uniref:serine hydrolase domain-containing protein n=1 Tax=Halosimplex salinum TaxID=1710538 RepID=UPI000F47E9F2|nr:serine hydrolase domain-containing protein [Halosimplex salinum]